MLLRRGNGVYIGKIGDPIEDVDFDGIMLNPEDLQDMLKSMPGAHRFLTQMTAIQDKRNAGYP